MEYTQDIKTMKRWLILLFASIWLVYFVYISLHADQVRSLWQYMISVHTSSPNLWSGWLDNDVAVWSKQEETYWWNDLIKKVDTIIPSSLLRSNQDLDDSEIPNQNLWSWMIWWETFADDMTKSFEGMKLWNGQNKLVQELGIRYQYALKDTGDMYFFFLGSRFYDFRLILSELWWNVVEITNQKDILDNWLYADKITYLKLPAYKNKTLMIVIQKWLEKWLIIVPHPIYYKKKNLIKTLFEQAYSTNSLS